MKFDVHVFCEVRVKCPGIEARTHEDAVVKAREIFDRLYVLFETGNLRGLPADVTETEFAETLLRFLVDEPHDPGHERSTWHAGDNTGRYLVFVESDIEPRLLGPFDTPENRDRKALELRHDHGDEHGIFRLNLDAMTGQPVIESYGAAFFEEDQS